MLLALKECRLCPRECGVNRYEETGFCQSSAEMVVAKAYLHPWEEPCISGERGSGCIFFSHCNLSCIFCQNHAISHQGLGQGVSVEKLADLMLDLASQGAHNINLVTPTHYAPLLVESIKLAKAGGLSIPIVYNTNSYESVSTIESLKGHVDIYLADFKYWDDAKAVAYSHGPEYVATASKAIDAMFEQVGQPVFDDKGMMQKGLIVRHLMLPGMLLDTKKIITYLYERYGEGFYLSLMNQYTPMYEALNHEKLKAPINPKQYDNAIAHCEALGIERVFIQGEGTVTTSYVPDFQKPEF